VTGDPVVTSVLDEPLHSGRAAAFAAMSSCCGTPRVARPVTRLDDQSKVLGPVSELTVGVLGADPVEEGARVLDFGPGSAGPVAMHAATTKPRTPTMATRCALMLVSP
jgi:hypothetical protein